MAEIFRGYTAGPEEIPPPRPHPIEVPLTVPEKGESLKKLFRLKDF